MYFLMEQPITGKDYLLPGSSVVRKGSFLIIRSIKCLLKRDTASATGLQLPHYIKGNMITDSLDILSAGMKARMRQYSHVAHTRMLPPCLVAFTISLHE